MTVGRERPPRLIGIVPVGPRGRHCRARSYVPSNLRRRPPDQHTSGIRHTGGHAAAADLLDRALTGQREIGNGRGEAEELRAN